MPGPHLVHHDPGVLLVTNNIEPRTSEAHPSVTSPVEHTAPPASRGRSPHVVADLLTRARDGVQEDDNRSVLRKMAVIREIDGGCSPVLEVYKLSGEFVSSEEALVVELLEEVESKVAPLA